MQVRRPTALRNWNLKVAKKRLQLYSTYLTRYLVLGGSERVLLSGRGRASRTSGVLDDEGACKDLVR